MSWADTAGTVVASVLASGGFVAIVNTLANRRKTKVDVADALSDSALEQLRAVRADAMEQIALARRDGEESRRSAEEARRSATQAWAEASEARREAMAVGAQLRQLTTAILSPSATIEQLRTLVTAGGGGGQNGYYNRH